MNELLHALWGDATGFRCIASGKFRHKFSESNDLIAPEGRDVWFAPSIFNKASRKACNVISLNALYLDVDCGEGKPYASVIEAGAAIASFISDYDLPSPTIVGSGNGLHVYFISDTPMMPAEWGRISEALRNACVDAGIQADHSVTQDIARLLRVPGTFNYKDPSNPKPVELLTQIEIHSLDDIRESFARFASAKSNDFKIALPQTPKDAGIIADKCQQLHEFRHSGGNIPEPQWYAGLGVIALCENAKDIACEWSKGHPAYSASETLAKLAHAADFAPTTCSRFEEVNPSGCVGCKYKDTISSPIQLGELPPASDAPLIPVPYKISPEGVYILICSDDDKPIKREAILFSPLWVSKIMVGDDDKGTEIELTWVNGDGKTKKANFRQSLMASPQNFEAALRDRNIYFFSQIRNVIIYINRSIQHVAKHFKEEVVYDKFGFTGDMSRFILGTDVISNNGGGETANISVKVDRKRIFYANAAGSIDSWRKASRCLDTPQFWPHRFTVMACIGSPLFALSKNEGSVLSLAGESSSGKTTATNFGISAYANPKGFTIDPQSTLKSFYEHWRQAANLPIVVNEAATIRRDVLPNLILAAANGKARDTLTKDGRLNDTGTWETLTVFTSNISLLQFSSTVLSDACKARIFEIYFRSENKLPLTLGRPLNAAIERNYGTAGRLFLNWILRHSEETVELVNQTIERFENEIDSIHRYRLWLIASAAAAGSIARHLNIIDFEIDDAILNAVDTLKQQVAEDISMAERVLRLVSEYTNKFQKDIGVKAEIGWHREPFSEARGRIDNNDKPNRSVSIPAKMLKEYAIDSGIDARTIDDALPNKKQVRLSTAGGPMLCYVIEPW